MVGDQGSGGVGSCITKERKWNLGARLAGIEFPASVEFTFCPVLDTILVMREDFANSKIRLFLIF